MVQLSSYPRPPATVIEVVGDVDACDADHVAKYLFGFVHVDHPLILDLGGVGFMGVAGLRAVQLFAEKCRAAGRDWVLVTSQAVNILLRVSPDYWLPTVDTLEDAVQHLATTVPNRSVTSDSAKLP
jgi:anti-anti-sigma factor